MNGASSASSKSLTVSAKKILMALKEIITNRPRYLISLDIISEPKNYIAIQISTTKKENLKSESEYAYSDSLNLEISKSIIQYLGGAIKFVDGEKGESITIKFPFSTEKSESETAIHQ